MAAEVSALPVNGAYVPHQGYNGDHHHHHQQQHHQQHQHPGNGQFNAQQPPYQPNTTASSNDTATATPASSQGAETSQVPKDEVGWFFVEQYYTTLSKSPDKLYLYYNKRSQFVHGNETDKVEVCVGQRAINDRMKDLDFEDCKVRITNVDSQASDQNIVIQVIGEISNKSQPHRKFTQTFVLATQTNGYFVLNDIFRFLIEEEDDEQAVQQDESAPPAGEVEEAPTSKTAPQPAAPVVVDEKPKNLTSSSDPVAVEQDAKKVDKTIEQKLLASETEKPAPTAETSETPERPTEPEPTPAASPPKQIPAQPASTPSAPKPVIPKTWASLAASANKTPTGAAKAATPASQTQTQPQRSSPVKPATVAPPTGPAAANSTPTAPAAAREEAQAGESDEWTAVGSTHNRQQSRQVNGQQQQHPQQQQQQQQQHQPRPQPEGPQRRGFIKNVSESVTMPALREALEKIAKVVDLDISHAKNCAFVEFETPEGYLAVVAANPITVGSDQLYVEERKVRAANGGFISRGQFQGGRGGRGDFRGGRGGNAPQRGRGGQAGAARGGRGGAQQP